MLHSYRGWPESQPSLTAAFTWRGGPSRAHYLWTSVLETVNYLCILVMLEKPLCLPEVSRLLKGKKYRKPTYPSGPRVCGHCVSISSLFWMILLMDSHDYWLDQKWNHLEDLRTLSAQFLSPMACEDFILIKNPSLLDTDVVPLQPSSTTSAKAFPWRPTGGTSASLTEGWWKAAIC